MPAISEPLRTLQSSGTTFKFCERAVLARLSTPCGGKMARNDDLRIRPGRIRSTRAPKAKSFLAQALRATEKAGGLSRGGASRGGSFGRGRAASIAAARLLNNRARGTMVKARVVRRSRALGTLQAHIGYLKRDGVTRDGSPGKLFDAAGDDADGRAFAERCA